MPLKYISCPSVRRAKFRLRGNSVSEISAAVQVHVGRQAALQTTRLAASHTEPGTPGKRIPWTVDRKPLFASDVSTMLQDLRLPQLTTSHAVGAATLAGLAGTVGLWYWAKWLGDVGPAQVLDSLQSGNRDDEILVVGA